MLLKLRNHSLEHKNILISNINKTYSASNLNNNFSFSLNKKKHKLPLERAGKFRTHIASGLRSSVCTTGLQFVNGVDMVE